MAFLRYLPIDEFNPEQDKDLNEMLISLISIGDTIKVLDRVIITSDNKHTPYFKDYKISSFGKNWIQMRYHLPFGGTDYKYVSKSNLRSFNGYLFATCNGSLYHEKI